MNGIYLNFNLILFYASPSLLDVIFAVINGNFISFNLPVDNSNI